MRRCCGVNSSSLHQQPVEADLGHQTRPTSTLQPGSAVILRRVCCRASTFNQRREKSPSTRRVSLSLCPSVAPRRVVGDLKGGCMTGCHSALDPPESVPSSRISVTRASPPPTCSHKSAVLAPPPLYLPPSPLPFSF